MNKEYKKPKQFRAYLALAWYALKAQTRNPATFAFGFIFPIVFISIFGLIGGSDPKIALGIPNDQTNQQFRMINQDYAKHFESQKIIQVQRDTKEALLTKLKQGKIAGIVEQTVTNEQNTPFALHVQTSSANPQQAGTLLLLLNNDVTSANLMSAKENYPELRIPQKLVHDEIAGRKSRYIDFALPGQIGFSLLSTAIFGTVFGLIYLKKAGVLKRMFATPTKALTILLAQGTSRLIVALLQTLLILAIGVLVFNFYLPHGIITFIELLVLSAIGLIAFLGFGYFFAGIANDENSAGPLVNLITLPQFLLSGTFFPTDSLPGWLQPIANNLPLSYLNLAIRKITTEGGAFSETIPYIIGLLIWGAIMYILAAKTFRWE